MEEVGRWPSVAKMSQAELWVFCSCFFPVHLLSQILLEEQGIQENTMKAKEIHYLWHCMIHTELFSLKLQLIVGNKCYWKP